MKNNRTEPTDGPMGFWGRTITVSEHALSGLMAIGAATVIYSKADTLRPK
jgi:hypothetical protein